MTRQQLDILAKMNAIIQEMLNISGALLVKLFGGQKRKMLILNRLLKMCVMLISV